MRYLVVDMNNDYKEIMNYEGLKTLLIETVQNDLLMNCSIYEVSKSCSDILCTIAKNNYKNEWLKEQLGSYCYKVIDLFQLRYDLQDLKEYFNDNVFDTVLEIINKGVE